MKNKKYTAYAVTTTILEELALVAVVLWLLPRFGINIPLWGLILMMAALGAVAGITYWLGKRALDKEPIVSLEIGSRGIAATPLAPKGYVRVNGELWQASSTGSPIDKNAEVVIARIKGLTLFVTPVDRSNHKVNKRDIILN